MAEEGTRWKVTYRELVEGLLKPLSFRFGPAILTDRGLWPPWLEEHLDVRLESVGADPDVEADLLRVYIRGGAIMRERERERAEREAAGAAAGVIHQ